jgi:hypothetical protein
MWVPFFGDITAAAVEKLAFNHLTFGKKIKSFIFGVFCFVLLSKASHIAYLDLWQVNQIK